MSCGHSRWLVIFLGGFLHLDFFCLNVVLYLLRTENKTKRRNIYVYIYKYIYFVYIYLLVYIFESYICVCIYTHYIYIYIIYTQDVQTFESGLPKYAY